MTGKFNRLTAEEKEVLRQQFEKKRHDYESKNLGNYTIIYPPPGEDTTQYVNYMESAKTLWEEFTGSNKKRATEDSKAPTNVNSPIKKLSQLNSPIKNSPTKKLESPRRSTSTISPLPCKPSQQDTNFCLKVE